MTPRPLAWVGAATLLGALFRLRGIGAQPLTGDELLTLPTALGYVASGVPGPVMPFHPNLRNLVLWATSQLFGPGLVGVKGVSLLLGCLCVPLLGHLVWRLTKDARTAGVAALLLAVDPVSIYFSRQAFSEVWTAFFALAGVALVLDAWESGEVRRWRWELPLAGALFGAGVAAKFYVVPVWAACTAALVLACARARRWPEALFAASALTGAAALVYLGTCAPWFSRGFGAGEWLPAQAVLFEAMSTHTKPLVNHWRFSQPALWFLEPFYGWVDVLEAPGARPLAMAVGNPLAWLLVLPAALWWLWRRRAERAWLVPGALFLAAWAPLVAARRPVWLLSSLVVLPFAFALVALAAGEVQARLPDRVGRAAVAGWLALVLAGSAALWPAVIGRARDVGYLAPLLASMGDYGPAQRGD